MMTIVIKCSLYLVCHTDSVITCNIGSRLVFYIFFYLCPLTNAWKMLGNECELVSKATKRRLRDD